MSVNIFARTSGAGNGCANYIYIHTYIYIYIYIYRERDRYGRLEFLRSFCRRTSTPIKFLVLQGGRYLGFLGGGGSADSGGHLKPITLKPVSRIFRVFVSAFFPHFPRFHSVESHQTLLFLG